MSIYTMLACIGLMFILKYGTILDRPRKLLMNFRLLNDLFTCSLCLGFWVGVIVGSFLYYFSFDYNLILLPFASAACCWIVDNINNVIQSIEIKLDKDNE